VLLICNINRESVIDVACRLRRKGHSTFSRNSRPERGKFYGEKVLEGQSLMGFRV
jgi:hypothetical protein